MIVTYNRGTDFEYIDSITVGGWRSKFDSAITEYIYNDMDSWADQSSGDAESPTGWFAKAGDKRIIRGDEQGFVWVERFADEAERDRVYDALDEHYGAWSDDELDDSTREQALATAHRHIRAAYDGGSQ
jgi:hypothetical protein